jgi:hypothetical protein
MLAALSLLALAVSSAVHADEIHNVIDCSIVGMDRQILREFPGRYCVFLPDGRVATARFNRLVMRGPDGRELWNQRINVTHQMNLDVSGKRILAIGLESGVKDGKNIDFNVVTAFDLEGHVLGRFSFAEHLAEIEAFLPELRKKALRDRWPGMHNLSHVNSVYEIPENPRAKSDPAFRRGNFVINSLNLDLTLIVDSALKKVLWVRPLERFGTVQTHDVQVLPNGHLLFYRNEGHAGNSAGCCSGLVEYDLEHEAPAWSWQDDPPGRFYASAFGGVQLLSNGNILFNNGVLGYAREITRSGQPVWGFSLSFKRKLEGTSFFRVRRFDLTSFLATNHDLSSIPSAPANDLLASADEPPTLYGYVDSGGLMSQSVVGGFEVADPRVGSSKFKGLDVRVNGQAAPLFMLNDRLFAVRLTNRNEPIRSIELVQQGRPEARVLGPAWEAYPGIYVTELGKP